MDEEDYVSLILYYGRKKFYHSMQKASLDGLAKHSRNSSFRLFNGFALVLGNRVQEGIRELNPLKNDIDFAMASVLALIYGHKRCNVIDKEAVISLDAKLKEERKKLTENSAYNAALFLFLSGKIEKSREYCEKSLRLNADFYQSSILKAWCELYLNPRASKTILDVFEKALEKGKNIDASLGQVYYYQICGDFENAIAVLNKLSIRFPELNIPLTEKMETQLASWNWDHSFETANRIINLEPTNISALRIKALLLICREGNIKTGLQVLQQLFSAIERVELNNLKLILSVCQLFSRVSGRNSEILSLTIKYVDKIVQASPGNAEFITEQGYEYILLGNYKDAVKYFRSATKVDDSSIYALCGLTLCQFAESGTTEQVRQQIEFLTEIQGIDKIPLLLYMTAKIADNADKSINYLIEACEIHFKNLKTISFGPEYLQRFDPDFLLLVVDEMLQHSPVQQQLKIGVTISKESLHISLKHCLNILETVVKACPGLVKATFLLAKVQFLCGENSFASNTLSKILNEIDPTYVNAHLLIAQIHIQQGQFMKGLQNLEICLSHNFKVRENPFYHLLHGIVEKSQLQYEDAQKSFLTAMNLIGVKSVTTSNLKVSTPVKGTGKTAEKPTLTLADKVTLFLELIDTYAQLGQNLESEKLMQCAFEEFSNTPEEGRLAIANADIVLQKGNVNKAIELLKSIQPGQLYYLQAKNSLANLYLHHKKDRIAFAQCFKELVEYYPEPESYLMLGDAYMSIQEPESAINAYKQAISKNPSDSLLASKLGKAYVKTHQYARAINYYREAVMNPDHSILKLDLAELYLKLKQFANAEKTLVEDLDLEKIDENDISVLQMRTKQLLLLARIREKAGNLSASLMTLKEARDNQYRVQKRTSIEQSGNLNEQHEILSKICVLMAEQSISLRENEQACKYYMEALKYTPSDIVVLASLARLYMQINQLEQCKEMCSHILQIDANNEAASVMMADLSFRKMDFESAAYHFSQLLIAQPNYWTALARLVEVMRRSGTLHEASAFLSRAEQSCPNPLDNAGLNYCKGLFEWYSSNPNSALKFFNYARRDEEWGQQAIFNMIEICLNPDGDLPNTNDDIEDMDFKDSRIMALRTAERLLKELKPRPGGMDNEAVNHRLLTNFLLLASKQKFEIEKALQDLTEIASQEEYRELVGPVYGISCAFIYMKQTQRAKNQLKRIAKNTWNFEEAEYLERCWLILADLYIQANKYDIAQEFLQKVLKHNKSCAKAYEFQGYIAEKEQSYKNAASAYDNAWRFGGKSKPQIGYKLAQNHMKVKKYADAVDICQQVLKIHPDYHAIRKDIMDKCRNNLRN
ncbi:tetratricopeptide repeat protein 21B-like [Condylostylus longicornis]|uniref:tetratricopeptide repeat protein 21B-like n=1 Tax=Condylostylus longicornis TaxID=2530218 RepID=UPI00244E5075|nr:tetratricopeptide repeat protein 21B-like [Condylostylus longicornis]XP_055385032.1 tetratricopeptide repeat protein 21B-like [Condylostylus longicornis]XP_055385033.1 tetratricopeptide repeat protein 21B-like [Condylostylus longicornis]